MSTAPLRQEFEDLIRRDLLGPAGGEQETVTAQSMRNRYLLGMLAPLKLIEIDEEPFEELADGSEDNAEEGTGEPATPAKRGVAPSTFGLSFCLDLAETAFDAEARWGQYLREPDADGKTVWKRYPRFGTRSIPLKEGTLSAWAPDRECPQVLVRGRVRRRAGHWSVTLFLSNEQVEDRPRDMYWLFQAELAVRGRFTRRPGARLYAGRRFAHGGSHQRNALPPRRGIRPWPRHQRRVGIRRRPRGPCRLHPHGRHAAGGGAHRPECEVPGLITDMQELAEAADGNLAGKLRPMTEAYTVWIAELESRRTAEADLLDYADASAEVVERARAVLARLEEGIALLAANADARDAFRFANRAMWQQRVPSVWIEERKADPARLLADADIPRNRSWRAFQLAFILINLAGLTSLHHPDRGTDSFAGADLLWFPTGGGKTEAYLGLAAYTMAIRRLQKNAGGRDGENGVAVLMRYTLRLLTLQQFQRAATLMCACEQIRQGDTARWGETPFRLGLWVGRKTTPNRTAQSAEVVEALRSGRRPVFGVGSPHQFPACPWCGAVIDPGQHITVEHYPSGRTRTIVYCGDTLGRCEYSRRKSPDEGLPLVVVDEEIYRRPPSMLIATVDKFAQMAWQGAVKTLFGQVTGWCPRHGFRSPELEDTNSHQAAGRFPVTVTQPHALLRPPDLIIQDELHLISGPLGSLVGIYEGAVDRLGTWEVDGKMVRPKVIASTATVRRAAAQVAALFNRKVCVFPPPGLDAGVNFFSRELPVSDDAPGRLYVGACAPGRKLKGALIRVYVAVLAAGQTLYEKYGESVDPFLTAVGYFSSLRELGGMRRLVDDDVRSRLTQVDARGLKRRNLRLPHAVEELTSRKSALEIPEVLERMTCKFPAPGAKAAKPPIDVLLATNMLSVGVDVGRLGLMIVAGQPKSTSEYIQATSRVGRASPGLVITVANWARPRDLSHFESFCHYHATFYKQVEALSVTPYSTGAMDRALTGVLVSAIRQGGADYNANNTAQQMQPSHALVQAALALLPVRAGEAGTGGAKLEDDVRAALKQRIDGWEARARRMRGGARLGYKDGRDGVTVGLLQMAGTSAWTEFTVLNSLRDVEPEAALTFNDDGMDSVEAGH
ncbi:MAG: DISARM system helicase DrmA [Candidatus Solibacter sp.]